TAVYLVALRRLIDALGEPTARVATRGLLVMTRNFTMDAAGSMLDLRPQVQRLERVLANFPHVTRLAASIPTAVSLPAPPDKHASEEQKKAASAQATEAIDALPI